MVFPTDPKLESDADAESYYADDDSDDECLPQAIQRDRLCNDEDDDDEPLTEYIVKTLASVINQTHLGHIGFWKISTSDDLLKIHLRNPCCVTKGRVHKSDWLSYVALDLVTWKATLVCEADCGILPLVVLDTQDDSSYEKYINMLHRFADIYGKINTNIMTDGDVVNRLLDLSPNTTWYQCNLDETCKVLYSTDPQFEKIVGCLSENPYPKMTVIVNGSIVDKVDKQTDRMLDVLGIYLFQRQFMSSSLHKISGISLLNKYIWQTLEGMTICKEKDKVYTTDKARPYIVDEGSATSIQEMIEDLLRKAPAVVQSEFAKTDHRFIENQLKKINQLMKHVPLIERRECYQFTNGLYPLPVGYVKPDELPKLFETWEQFELKNGRTKPFLPRRTFDMDFQESFFTSREPCANILSIVEYQLDKDTDEELCLHGMVGRAQVYKQNVRSGKKDALGGHLHLSGESESGKSTFLTAIGGEKAFPGLWRKIVGISGGCTGDGGVGGMSRFVQDDPDLAMSPELPADPKSALYSSSNLCATNIKLIFRSEEGLTASVKHKENFNGACEIPWILVSQTESLGADYHVQTYDDLWGYFRSFCRFKFSKAVLEKDPDLGRKCRDDLGPYALFSLHKYMEMLQKWNNLTDIPFHQEYMRRMVKQRHPYGEYLSWCAEVYNDPERYRKDYRGVYIHNEEAPVLVPQPGSYVTASAFKAAYKAYRVFREYKGDVPFAVITTENFLKEARAIELFGFNVVRQGKGKCRVCDTCKKQQGGLLVPFSACAPEHKRSDDLELRLGTILNVAILDPR